MKLLAELTILTISNALLLIAGQRNNVAEKVCFLLPQPASTDSLPSFALQIPLVSQADSDRTGQPSTINQQGVRGKRCWPASADASNASPTKKLSTLVDDCGILVLPSECLELLTAVTWLKPDAMIISVHQTWQINTTANATLTSNSEVICLDDTYLGSERSSNFLSDALVEIKSPSAPYSLDEILALTAENAARLYEIRPSSNCVHKTNLTLSVAIGETNWFNETLLLHSGGNTTQIATDLLSHNNLSTSYKNHFLFESLTSSNRLIVVLVHKAVSWQTIALLRHSLPVENAEKLILLVFVVGADQNNGISDDRHESMSALIRLMREELAPIENITIVEIGTTPVDSAFSVVYNYIVQTRPRFVSFSTYRSWLAPRIAGALVQSTTNVPQTATMFARLWYAAERSSPLQARSTYIEFPARSSSTDAGQVAIMFRDALNQTYLLAQQSLLPVTSLNSTIGNGSSNSNQPTIVPIQRSDSASSGSPTTVVFVILALCALVLICTIVYKAVTRCNKQAELEKVIADRSWWRIAPFDLRLEDKKRGVVNSSVFASELTKSGKRTLVDGLDLSSALYRGKLTVVRVCPDTHGNRVVFTSKVLQELKVLTELRCKNLARFVGLCETENKYIFVWEHGQHGTLTHVLANYNLELDWAFKLGFCLDIASGIAALHHSPIKFHGDLRSTNCIVSSNFIIKVADFGLYSLRGQLQHNWNGDDSIQNDRSLLWKAPEFLRHPNPGSVWNGSQKGDMWSFGIVMQEIALRIGPYDNPEISVMEFEPRDIIAQLRSRRHDRNQFRPRLSPGACPEDYRYLMDYCLEEASRSRPASFNEIHKMILAMIDNEVHGVKERNVELHRLSKYTKNLEDLVKERTKDMAKVRQQHVGLIEWLVPQPVLHRMMSAASAQTNSTTTATTTVSNTLALPPMVTITSPAPQHQHRKSATPSINGKHHQDSSLDTIPEHQQQLTTRLWHIPVACVPELYQDVTFMVVRFPQITEMAALACRMPREQAEAFVVLLERLTQFLLNLTTMSSATYLEWLSTPDKYVFVCGAPKRIGSRHAQEIVALACRTNQCLRNFELQLTGFEAALAASPTPQSGGGITPESPPSSHATEESELSSRPTTPANQQHHHQPTSGEKDLQQPQDLAALVTTNKQTRASDVGHSAKHLLPRIGINSGRAVDLVVGKKHCKYTMLSTALNAAEVIANHAEASETLVSIHTINALPKGLRTYRLSPDGFSKQFIDVQLETSSGSSSCARATLLPKFDVKMHATNDYYFTYTVDSFEI